MSNLIKVILVDDHQLMLDGLQLIFHNEVYIDILATANNGEELIKLLEIHIPDIILLDIHMPKMNGLETLKHLTKFHPEIKVIGLSMVDESAILKNFFKYGGKGFILKNCTKSVILEAITKVYNGEKFFDENIVKNLLEYNSKKSKSNQFHPKLSTREKEIATLIIAEKTTQEISDELFISFGTVETHRRNIINKLGVKNTAGLVRVIMEYNLLN